MVFAAASLGGIVGFLEECGRVKGKQSSNIIPVVREDRSSLGRGVLCGHFLSGCGHFLSGILNQA